MEIPKVNWILVGIIVGSFWGILADFFYTRAQLGWKTRMQVAQSILVLLFQFFFNFIGGFAGCVGIGLFLDRYSQGHFGAYELVLIGISLLGVSGKLSELIYKIPGIMNDIAKLKAPKP